MRLILILLSILWIVAGVLLFILTDAMRQICRNLLKIKNLKPFSVLAIIAGIVFIMASSLVSVPWVAILLGLLAIAKGLFFIFAPQKKVKAFFDWWLNASNGIYRSWGIMAFLLGVLILLML